MNSSAPFEGVNTRLDEMPRLVVQEPEATFHSRYLIDCLNMTCWAVYGFLQRSARASSAGFRPQGVWGVCG